ncbi:hypothetical protein Q3G72_005757 [Acer saccharum]|nr:hypothetical protein Q3G72_005757 [Acer saccharum]
MAKFVQYCRGCGGDHHMIKWTRSSQTYNKSCLLAACVEGANNYHVSCKTSLSKTICLHRGRQTTSTSSCRSHSFTEKQEELIINLHRIFGNRWSLIARELPGKTSEDIRNLCRRKHMKRKLQSINEPRKDAFVNEVKNPDEKKGTDQLINNIIDLNKLPSSEEYLKDFGCKNPLSFDLNQIPPEAVVMI